VVDRNGNGHTQAALPLHTPPDPTTPRLGALRVAAVFLAGSAEAKSQDVLLVAERFEEWLRR
jgi:hypothetical protein